MGVLNEKRCKVSKIKLLNSWFSFIRYDIKSIFVLKSGLAGPGTFIKSGPGLTTFSVSIDTLIQVFLCIYNISSVDVYIPCHMRKYVQFW